MDASDPEDYADSSEDEQVFPVRDESWPLQPLADDEAMIVWSHEDLLGIVTNQRDEEHDATQTKRLITTRDAIGRIREEQMRFLRKGDGDGGDFAEPLEHQHSEMKVWEFLRSQHEAIQQGHWMYETQTLDGESKRFRLLVQGRPHNRAWKLARDTLEWTSKDISSGLAIFAKFVQSEVRFFGARLRSFWLSGNQAEDESESEDEEDGPWFRDRPRPELNADELRAIWPRQGSFLCLSRANVPGLRSFSNLQISTTTKLRKLRRGSLKIRFLKTAPRGEEEEPKEHIDSDTTVWEFLRFEHDAIQKGLWFASVKAYLNPEKRYRLTVQNPPQNLYWRDVGWRFWSALSHLHRLVDASCQAVSSELRFATRR